uniref:NADH-ubiquinone oxidoreductase chain 6 n=1 Tax=Chironex fleckeri TaxID=45396 RepID=G9IT31_CHIFL|nr:NADH dehydrogenase subunit 6 [Chironex fleckeri]
MWVDTVLGSIVLISGVMVIYSFNPVYSVVWLVLSFLFSSVWLWCFGLDFLCLVLIMVYVGAIAVLFVFVLMMLPTSKTPSREDLTMFVPLIVFLPVSIVLGSTTLHPWLVDTKSYPLLIGGEDLVTSISTLLYGPFVSVLFIVGLILLVSLVAALILCLSPGVMGGVDSKKQDSFVQVSR